MKGLYINLDRCTERKSALCASLASACLDPSDYLRFSALEPVGDEVYLSRGLKSRGELGIFQSLIEALSVVAKGDFDDVVHIAEDDNVYMPLAGQAISNFSRILLSKQKYSNVDIVFLDYFMTLELFKYVVSIKNKLAPGQVRFLPAKRFYLAGCGSFLVRKSSAYFLSKLLSNILDSADSLVPVDITLRSLFRMGALSGLLSVPSFSAPCWEQDESSSIQGDSDDSRRFSQRSHILLRLLASGAKTPQWCSQTLEQLSGVKSPAVTQIDYDSFSSYFESLNDSMVSF